MFRIAKTALLRNMEKAPNMKYDPFEISTESPSTKVPAACAVAEGGSGQANMRAFSKPRRKPKMWRKPKGMPKRPLSAYNIFFAEERRRIILAREANLGQESLTLSSNATQKKANTGMGFAGLARVIASRWRSLDPETKGALQRRSEVERKRYRRELREWKKKINEVFAHSTENDCESESSSFEESSVSDFFECGTKKQPSIAPPIITTNFGISAASNKPSVDSLGYGSKGSHCISRPFEPEIVVGYKTENQQPSLFGSESFPDLNVFKVDQQSHLVSCPSLSGNCQQDFQSPWTGIQLTRYPSPVFNKSTALPNTQAGAIRIVINASCTTPNAPPFDSSPNATDASKLAPRIDGRTNEYFEDKIVPTRMFPNNENALSIQRVFPEQNSNSESLLKRLACNLDRDEIDLLIRL